LNASCRTPLNEKILLLNSVNLRGDYPAPNSPITPANQAASRGVFVDQNSVSIIAEIKQSSADIEDQPLSDIRTVGGSNKTAYDGSTRLNLSIDVGNDYSGLHPETLPAVDNLYSF
jgi:hypothetical protein